MKERTKRFRDATNPQNQKKEIAMKKRKSYAELEAVKKKNSVCSGFVIKSKGRVRLRMFCQVFGQLPH